jgi:IS1 family transposase
LEDRRTWLNKAVGEYEKSNKKLRDTLDRLQRENVMVGLSLRVVALWRLVRRADG